MIYDIFNEIAKKQPTIKNAFLKMRSDNFNE